jgi:lycopene beta-cyclase
VAPASRAWLEPLVTHRWDGYDVVFPDLRRSLAHGYASITSPRLDAVLRETLGQPGSRVLLGAEAVEIEPRRVVLRDGRVLEASLVVDARGPEATTSAPGQGYQKFLGLELVLARSTSILRPTIMDATVEQADGFRFVYVLPFAADRVLVEDTYYSDHAVLDQGALRMRVRAYAAAIGLEVKDVAREETGVLPIPWSVSAIARGGALRAGYAGGFFHPTTGYSLPIAVRVAEHLASRPPDKARDGAFHALVREQERQARFFRLLNWLLFRAYPPDQRWQVLQRFYRLPEATIRRFYSGELTIADRARLLLGRPPGGLSLKAAFFGRRAAA